MNFNPKDYEEQIYSQHGEDGIIAELIRRVKPMKYFVEIGAESGLENNTRYLAEQNWRGKQIEGREDAWRDLCDVNRPHRQRVHSLCEFVNLDNLEEVFLGVPREFGFLSVDVDGNDLWLAQEVMRTWRPAIVCVEVNHLKPEDKPWVQPYDEFKVWDGVRTDYGASLLSMQTMAREAGYVYVGSDATRVNAFFVRSEDIGQLD